MLYILVAYVELSVFMLLLYWPSFLHDVSAALGR